MNNNESKVVTDVKNISEKAFYLDARVKELLAKPDVQTAIKNHIEVPKYVIIKKVSKPSDEHHTQKVEGLYGTTIDDAVTIKFTILDETKKYFLDPVGAINKKYRIIDYILALDANMSGKNFNGYSAVGLKLIVREIEEIAKGK